MATPQAHQPQSQSIPRVIHLSAIFLTKIVFTFTSSSSCSLAQMPDTARYVGERLSLKRQLCTIRYIGAVADKLGEWLGVEWDDSDRGKHDGTHNGVRYFTCKCCRSDSSGRHTF